MSRGAPSLPSTATTPLPTVGTSADTSTPPFTAAVSKSVLSCTDIIPGEGQYTPGLLDPTRLGLYGPGLPGLGQPGLLGFDHSGLLCLGHPGLLGLDHSGLLGLDHPGLLGLDHPGLLGLDHPGLLDHPGVLELGDQWPPARLCRVEMLVGWNLPYGVGVLAPGYSSNRYSCCRGGGSS